MTGLLRRLILGHDATAQLSDWDPGDTRKLVALTWTVFAGLVSARVKASDDDAIGQFVERVRHGYGLAGEISGDVAAILIGAASGRPHQLTRLPPDQIAPSLILLTCVLVADLGMTSDQLDRQLAAGAARLAV